MRGGGLEETAAREEVGAGDEGPELGKENEGVVAPERAIWGVSMRGFFEVGLVRGEKEKKI